MRVPMAVSVGEGPRPRILGDKHPGALDLAPQIQPVGARKP